MGLDRVEKGASRHPPFVPGKETLIGNLLIGTDNSCGSILPIPRKRCQPAMLMGSQRMFAPSLWRECLLRNVLGGLCPSLLLSVQVSLAVPFLSSRQLFTTAVASRVNSSQRMLRFASQRTESCLITRLGGEGRGTRWWSWLTWSSCCPDRRGAGTSLTRLLSANLHLPTACESGQERKRNLAHPRRVCPTAACLPSGLQGHKQ